MGHSLKQRFNGSSKEVVDFARKWGVLRAMEKYQVSDYIAMTEFLKGVSSEESVGDNPIFSPFGAGGGATPYEKLVACFADFVIQSNERIKKLEAELVIERQRARENRDIEIEKAVPITNNLIDLMSASMNLGKKLQEGK